MRKRKEKQKGRKRKERRNKEKRICREKMEENEKGGKRKVGFFRVSGSRRSTVLVLKLVHAVGSTCGHQKVGVSTNSKR